MSSRNLAPGQVWWVDFDPTVGREQGKPRPSLIVSTELHLRLTRGELLTVVPFTTAERPGWLHRVALELPGHKRSWAITEQIRTVSAHRLVNSRPIGVLTEDQLSQVNAVLRRMVTLH